VLVKEDTGSGIEDGGAGVTNEISGDNLVLSVTNNTLKRTLSGSLDNLLNVIVRSSLLETDSQVNNGDIDGGDTEGKTGELTVELGDDLTDSLGSTGGGGDNVTRGGTATSPVLVGRTVDGLLGGSDGVDSGHQTLNDTEVVVDDLGKGSQTVGGARSVRDDLEVRSVLVLVDTDDEHGSVSRRSRDDNLLGTTLQVSRGLLGGGENTGGLNNVVGTGLTPRNGSGITLAKDGDLLAINDDVRVIVGDLTLVLAVGRVVLEHVSSVLNVNEGIVDSDNSNLGVLEGVSENNTADSAETVNTNVDHFD